MSLGIIPGKRGTWRRRCECQSGSLPSSCSPSRRWFRLRDDADPVAVIFHPFELRTGVRWASPTVAESGLGSAAPTSPLLFTPQALEEVLAGDVTPGCEDVIAWEDDSFARLDGASAGLPETPEAADVASIDPAMLRQAAGDIRDAAAAQEASNPPAVAADANGVMVDLYNLMIDGADRLAEAVQDGDLAAFDAAVADFGEAAETFFDDEFTPVLETLGAACPELNEIE